MMWPCLLFSILSPTISLKCCAPHSHLLPAPPRPHLCSLHVLFTYFSFGLKRSPTMSSSFLMNHQGSCLLQNVGRYPPHMAPIIPLKVYCVLVVSLIALPSTHICYETPEPRLSPDTKKALTETNTTLLNQLCSNIK